MQRSKHKPDALRGSPTLTVVDLFAGAGGATQGLTDAGWNVVAAVENDDDAADTYAANHPAVELCRDSIEAIDPDDLRRTVGLEPRELGLLKACPPCQGFSTLGSRDSEDPRNDLLGQVWKFLRGFRPKSFILENVPGLQGDPRLEKLKRQARGAGYKTREYVVNATDFGVPQHRSRLIVLGVLGLAGELPKDLGPAESGSVGTGDVPVSLALSLAGAVDGFDELHRTRTLTEIVRQRIQAVPPGGTRFDLPAHLQLDCHSRLKRRHATSSYGRMKLDEPAPTMTTRCTTPACGRFIHPLEDRPITLREAALIQTFPSDYAFRGSRGSVERQIGNAVPVRMASALGEIAKRFVSEDDS